MFNTKLKTQVAGRIMKTGVFDIDL